MSIRYNIGIAEDGSFHLDDVVASPRCAACAQVQYPSVGLAHQSFRQLGHLVAEMRVRQDPRGAETSEQYGATAHDGPEAASMHRPQSCLADILEPLARNRAAQNRQKRLEPR